LGEEARTNNKSGKEHVTTVWIGHTDENTANDPMFEGWG